VPQRPIPEFRQALPGEPRSPPMGPGERPASGLRCWSGVRAVSSPAERRRALLRRCDLAECRAKRAGRWFTVQLPTSWRGVQRPAVERPHLIRGEGGANGVPNAEATEWGAGPTDGGRQSREAPHQLGGGGGGGGGEPGAVCLWTGDAELPGLRPPSWLSIKKYLSSTVAMFELGFTKKRSSGPRPDFSSWATTRV